MSNAESEFLDALVKFGMDVPGYTVVQDGVIRRAHIQGHKPGSENGWYWFKGGYGMFGDWKSGIKEVWRATGLVKAKPSIQLATPSIEELQASARKRAGEIWAAAQPEDGSHQYIRAKGVNAFGLRRKDEVLIIPVRDEKNVIHSLQFIYSDGTKRFLKNGRKKACFFMIGKLEGDVLCVAEGYGTGASVHEATGYPVAVAFDSGNLMPVGEVLRCNCPNMKLVYCADNDVEVEGNPGLSKAQAAADKTGGIVITPTNKGI